MCSSVAPQLRHCMPVPPVSGTVRRRRHRSRRIASLRLTNPRSRAPRSPPCGRAMYGTTTRPGGLPSPPRGTSGCHRRSREVIAMAMVISTDRRRVRRRAPQSALPRRGLRHPADAGCRRIRRVRVGADQRGVRRPRPDDGPRRAGRRGVRRAARPAEDGLHPPPALQGAAARPVDGARLRPGRRRTSTSPSCARSPPPRTSRPASATTTSRTATRGTRRRSAR